MSPYGQHFEVGDRVAYSRLILDCIKVCGDRIENARGTVIDIQNTLALVRWDDPSCNIGGRKKYIPTASLVRDGHLDEYNVHYDHSDIWP